MDAKENALRIIHFDNRCFTIRRNNTATCSQTCRTDQRIVLNDHIQRGVAVVLNVDESANIKGNLHVGRYGVALRR